MKIASLGKVKDSDLLELVVKHGKFYGCVLFETDMKPAMVAGP